MKDKKGKLVKLTLSVGGVFLLVGVLVFLFGNKWSFFNIFRTDGLGFTLMIVGVVYFVIGGLLWLRKKR